MERLWTKPYVLLTTGILFLFTAFYFLLPTLPPYVRELGGDETHVGLAAGVFTFSAVVFRPLAGAWADRYGRKPLAIWGLAGFALTMALHSYAGGLAALIALRILQGICWSFATTAIGTLITDVIPPARRGEGLGWYGAAITLAMAVGPLAGTRIVEHASFLHLFGAAAILSFIPVFMAAAVRVPFRRTGAPARMLFIEKSLLPPMATAFLLTASYGGLVTFAPLFVPAVGGDPGLFFLVYALVLLLSRPGAGRLVDKLGEARVILPALCIAAAALAVLGLSRNETGVMAAAVLYAAGFGAAHPALQATVLRLAGPQRRGAANASYMIAFDLGIGSGSVLLGWVSQYAGYPMVFISGAVFVAAAFALFALSARRLAPAGERAGGTSGDDR